MTYDVNHSLDMLRKDVQIALMTLYANEHNLTLGQAMGMLCDIAETFDNLDDHLSKGGVAPDAWKP